MPNNNPININKSFGRLGKYFLNTSVFLFSTFLFEYPSHVVLSQTYFMLAKFYKNRFTGMCMNYQLFTICDHVVLLLYYKIWDKIVYISRLIPFILYQETPTNDCLTSKAIFKVHPVKVCGIDLMNFIYQKLAWKACLQLSEIEICFSLNLFNSKLCNLKTEDVILSPKIVYFCLCNLP